MFKTCMHELLNDLDDWRLSEEIVLWSSLAATCKCKLMQTGVQFYELFAYNFNHDEDTQVYPLYLYMLW